MTSEAPGTPWEQPHHEAGPAASRRSLWAFLRKEERESSRHRCARRRYFAVQVGGTSLCSSEVHRCARRRSSLRSSEVSLCSSEVFVALVGGLRCARRRSSLRSSAVRLRLLVTESMFLLHEGPNAQAVHDHHTASTLSTHDVALRQLGAVRFELESGEAEREPRRAKRSPLGDERSEVP